MWIPAPPPPPRAGPLDVLEERRLRFVPAPYAGGPQGHLPALPAQPSPEGDVAALVVAAARLWPDVAGHHVHLAVIRQGQARPPDPQLTPLHVDAEAGRRLQRIAVVPDPGNYHVRVDGQPGEDVLIHSSPPPAPARPSAATPRCRPPTSRHGGGRSRPGSARRRGAERSACRGRNRWGAPSPPTAARSRSPPRD